MIYDQASIALVHYFLLGGIAIGEAVLLYCLGGVYTDAIRNKSL
jgi:hypothetical protein